MALPRKLKNFLLFIDGISQQGVVTEVTLPKLTRKFEELRAGGMNGPVDTDLGMEKLEIEFALAGHDAAIYKQFGASRADAVALRFAGAVQRDDTGDVQSIEIVARGRYSEIDPGNAKAGDDTELKVKGSLSYYKLTDNGEVVVEIDLLNMIELVGGEDRLAAQRTAIGL